LTGISATSSSSSPSLSLSPFAAALAEAAALAGGADFASTFALKKKIRGETIVQSDV
jgi:hypothetical protein